MTHREPSRALLLGLGLDHQDGHVRVTRGEQMYLVGGSQETHEQMQEKAVKLIEAIEKRGKTLGEISHEEFHDIAGEIGLKK